MSEPDYLTVYLYAHEMARKDITKLKAENQGRQAENSVLAIENDCLKAEVERLEPELEQRCRELNLSLAQQAIQLRQIGELKAEVERLKAVSTIEQRTIQGLQKTPEWSEIARLTAYCRELEAKLNREGNQS